MGTTPRQMRDDILPPTEVNHAYFLATDDAVVTPPPSRGTNSQSQHVGEECREKAGEEEPIAVVPLKEEDPPLPFLSVQSIHKRCSRLVRNSNFQKINIFLIAINAIMMGIATCDFVTDNPRVDRIFEIVDTCFLLIFTVEITIQFIAHEGWKLFQDGWLLLDFVIILTNWVFIFTFREKSFNSVQVLRAFRILRALRLITRVRIMRKVVTTFLSTVPRMGAIGALLSLVFYIFAVIFTALFKDLYKEGLTSDDYFSRIDITFFTLFQIMTMDGWAIISREVVETYWWAWILFVVFVMISAFILVNVVIAVIFSTALDESSSSIQPALSTEWAPRRTHSFVIRSSASCPFIPNKLSNVNRDDNEIFASSDTCCCACAETTKQIQEQINGLSLEVKAILDALDRTEKSVEKLSMQLDTAQQTRLGQTEQSIA